jgi:hypothetical protein
MLRGVATPVLAAAAVLVWLAGPAAAGSLSRQITIQPIQVCQDDGTGCAQVGLFEDETDKIWAQAGIDILFRETAQLDQTGFLAINTRTREHVDLYRTGNALVGDPELTASVNLYFVDDIDSGLFGLGCGADLFAGYCGGEVGIIISDEVFSFADGLGRLDTLAHELGHVLGLTHTGLGAGGTENLMSDGASRFVPGSSDDIAPDGLGLDQLTSAQIDAVFTAPNDRFITATPVPEPAAAIQFGVGALLVAARLGGRRAQAVPEGVKSDHRELRRGARLPHRPGSAGTAAARAE